MLKDIRIPEISENVTSGKIVAVRVKVGDSVAVDDVLVEMETDKAVVEIPSPYAGRISEVLVGEGEEKNVGDVIIRIEASAEEEAAPVAVQPPSDDKPPHEEEQKEHKGEAQEKPEPVIQPAGATKPTEAPPAMEKTEIQPVPAAPSVRRFARELGVDIQAVQGSGPGGRISQEDVTAFVKQRLAGQTTSGQSGTDAIPAQPRLPDFSRWGNIRKEELETVRRLTAENTSLAWRIIPHVTQFDEADITDLQLFLQKHAKQAEKQGVKLTLTAVVMKVCAMALVKFPRFNASIDLERRELIFKEYIHIGMAADTPRGLLVPVIRHADRKGILTLAAEIADMAQKARDKKVPPDAFEGGTFTISNQGGIGGQGFTPIVVWPQAAILGVSRAKRSLVEIKDEFIPRTILPLSLSYDHRIIDGADAARFLSWVCASLQQPMTMLLS